MNMAAFPAVGLGKDALKKFPTTLSAQIHWMGCLLVQELQPWLKEGRAVALDSTGLWIPLAASVTPGAVLLYQLVLLYRQEQNRTVGLDINQTSLKSGLIYVEASFV